MQMLTIQAATPESARRLYSALFPFYPETFTDEGGNSYVSVQLSGSDRHVIEVLDAIHAYINSGSADEPVSSVIVELDDRKYTLHGTYLHCLVGTGP